MNDPDNVKNRGILRISGILKPIFHQTFLGRIGDTLHNGFGVGDIVNISFTNTNIIFLKSIIQGRKSSSMKKYEIKQGHFQKICFHLKIM